MPRCNVNTSMWAGRRAETTASKSTAAFNARRFGHRSLWVLGFVAALSMAWFFRNHAARDQWSEASLALASSETAGVWGPLPGRNYYVSKTGSDDHDGSAARPWATLQHAATKAESGSTVHVLPGLYLG